MAYHYVAPRPTQHLLVGSLLLTAIGLGSLAPVQAAWAALVGSASNLTLLVVGSLVVHLATFWPVALFFHRVDTRDTPAFIARHRIQSGPGRRPPLGKVLRNLAWNQLFWSPILLVGMGSVLLWRGWEAEAELPTVSRLLLELTGLTVAALIVFYSAHRFLHRTWWMRKVHRVHHEYRTSSALASEYAHPVEFCVGNFGTLAAGVLIFMPHLATIYLFTVLALAVILVHHSGYAIPWAPSAAHHDWHHYRVKEAFGTIGLLDRLLGTAPEFEGLQDGDVR